MKLGLVGISVIFLFYWIPFQDLVVSYFYSIGIPILLLKLLLILKEIMVLGLGSLLLFRNRISHARLFLILFLAYSIVTIPFSTIQIFTSFLGLRTYLLICFGFVLGEQVSRLPNYFERFVRHMDIVFLLVLVFSVLEYFVLPMSIWKSPFPVMEMKRQVANLSTTNEYYDFGYPVNAFGEITRRLLGPFDEPLYMAYFTVIMVNFYFVMILTSSRRAKSKAILGSILILLTQTRAIVLGYVISVVALVSKGARIKLKHAIVAGLLLLLLIPVSIYYSTWVITFISSIFDDQGRNRGHIDAYIDGFVLIFKNPFGGGIGSASSLVGFSEGNNATENAFINVGIEIGILGMVSLFGFFIYLILKFNKFIITSDLSALGAYRIVSVGYLLIIQFTFAGLVAPHILTARILIPFMIIMGWAYGSTRKFSD